MKKKLVGRALRSFAPSARALTEYRVRQLRGLAEFYDLALCIEYAKRGSVAIDVGASVGNYSLALRKAVGPAGQVLALEANPAVYQELRHSVWRSGVTALQVAASSHPGVGLLSVPQDLMGAAVEPLATLEPRTQGSSRSVEVTLVTLDSLIAAKKPVSLVKIDVEGHEASVLLGSVALIERDRPAFVIEIEQRHLTGGRTVRDVVEWMDDHGYACWGIHGRTLVPWADIDIRRDQLAWLVDGDANQTDLARIEYVNNFAFLARP